jgi:alpha-glucosidase
LGLNQADLPLEALRDPEGLEFWPAYKGRDGCRTPIPWEADSPHAGFTTGTPWLPVSDEHAALSVSTQGHDPDSTLHFVRRFLAWRRGIPALVTGDLVFLPAPPPLLMFTRGGCFTLAFNLGLEPVCVPHAAAQAAFNLGATWAAGAWTLPVGCGIILAGV